MNTDSHNPRFVAYAKAHGNTPARQVAADREQWPGGHMAGFIVWLSKQWWRWARQHDERREWGGAWSDAQHERFDAWLVDQQFVKKLETAQ